jgi:LPS O-antigen subunit length determinant protein (WzzB/FepE family)
MLVLSIILGILLIASVIALRNLLVKVEKYEDVVQDQVQYLQNISKTVTESQKHLQNLDERGVFQSDDEVGFFFEQLKAVQEELNRYMLPQNYGKKES